MPYNSNERLEREARESLVASDLSAKMKQWRNTPPEGGNRGNGAPLRILLVLLALGGAAWLFWPKAEKGNPLPPQEQPSELLPPVQQTVPPAQEPIAQKPAQSSNRYLALAQSNSALPTSILKSGAVRPQARMCSTMHVVRLQNTATPMRSMHYKTILLNTKQTLLTCAATLFSA